MSVLRSSEGNLILLGSSTLFTYLQVPIEFFGLLFLVMFADFFTGIAKVVTLSGVGALSLNAFWVGLLKKLTLIIIVMLFGLIVLAAKVTVANYPDNSTVKGLLESIHADYAVIFAFWVIFLNEILSVLCNAKMITTRVVCKKANVVELLGRYVEAMLSKLLPFEAREEKRNE